jgi:uncharacterized protein (DUF934 family)
LTGEIYEWKGEGNQKEGFRFDRMFRTSDSLYYLERERGTQGREKLRLKLERYMRHYRSTQEKFNVLILAEDGEQDFHLSLFKELGLGNHYSTALCSDVIKDPRSALLTCRFGQFQIALQTQSDSLE